ncbi:3-oxoacyl-ACP synthase [Vibrio genomosp. F6]|uniref:beta-ketoacyl synthase chain length factor n=1 Tax=Vibrio genomosp. F6 TaxID=723172 RepID=UPI0010BCEFC0|nr:beta-ketoacyl synthase chain length factor [Vibrio genomosp. F6]TKF22692.1 3-oxoacyl-ACP synthase [Vibrio genomosp. F6]
MSNHSQLVSFNLQSWAGHSLGISTPEGWEVWAKNKQWPEDIQIDTSKVPAMMRRRMSSQSKLAVQTALTALQNNDIDYLVFSSRHGELHRTAALIESILNGDDASPMAFSQSVHNTAAGLTTIAAKKTIPLSSIAAGIDTFHCAMLDAIIYLSEHPTHKILIVDFDQPLPNIYQEYEQEHFKDYAVGLIITAGNSYYLTRESTNTISTSVFPQSLDTLAHVINKSNSWSIDGNRQQWIWRKSI